MANDPYIQSFTCFDGTRRLLTAALPEVALALKQAVAGGAAGPLLVFDNATGRSVDLDIRGSSEDLLARPAGLQHALGGDPAADEDGVRLGQFQ
ncbi:DUF2239 family protein, partial [Pseudomonas aeruginosa]|nr:DUF2239 family protein [Pseudomonas aeruginosa]